MPKKLLSDDERISFAIELGWEPDGAPLDDDALTAFFALETLEARPDVDEHLLDGVDQALLDEVRDAVQRREDA